MHWEGDQAVEECSDDDDAIVQRRKAVLKSRPKHQRGDADKKPRQHQDARMVEPIKFEAEESDESDDSEDEYVEENGPKRVRSKQVSLFMKDNLFCFYSLNAAKHVSGSFRQHPLRMILILGQNDGA